MVDLAGWFGNITMLAADNFSAAEAFDFVKPLSMFVIGIVIYAVFIFKFYRFIARKEIFSIDLNATGRFAELKKGASMFYYAIKHMVAYPVILIFYFLVLVGLFSFLSRDPLVESIMLIAMALVASIRITAYYNEDLSRDLAKMIPFALLGVFLVDISFFSLTNSVNALSAIPSFWKTIFYYLAFVWILEIVLRLGSFAFKGKTAEDAEPDKDDSEKKTKKEKK